MYKQIELSSKLCFEELVKKANLKDGMILVIGCSTSEIIGDTIGTHSSMDVAKALYDGIFDALKDKNIYIAAQCCEHLNRALVIERELAVKLNLEIVNVVPLPKAGGSSATTAYSRMKDPVLVEHIKADAGVDIGSTLIGMHLKEIAVPLRLENNKIGQANIVCARVRPKFIGGERAVYNEELM
ncbi:MAG: TIGR01440 family protein [Ruminococcus sp.]|nr:TIGR01440 family protein [Ruminococcus sp.]